VDALFNRKALKLVESSCEDCYDEDAAKRLDKE